MNLSYARIARRLPALRSIRASATLLVGLLFVSLPAQAAIVSYFIDQSNALPDGTNYLRVDIEDAVFLLDTEAIKFTVTLLNPLTDIAGTNFGIQGFGFSTDGLGIATTDIVGLPADWTADGPHPPPNVLDGFGDFEFTLAGTGSSRQNPTLEFFITGIAGDAPEDYAVLSIGTADEGNQFFAAHVADFDGPGAVDSAFFGGQTLVPLPASFWLLVSALGGLGLSRRKLFARRAAPSPS